MERLYEDKLDGKINYEYYENLAERYQSELKHIQKSLENYTNASSKYHELGLNLYELSQKAIDIYKTVTRDDKRLLINLVFSDFYLQENRNQETYSKAFNILSELVKMMNSPKLEKTEKITAEIFEPRKKVDMKIQTLDFYPKRPTLLRD